MEHTKLQKHTEKNEKFFEEEPNNLFNLEAKKQWMVVGLGNQKMKYLTSILKCKIHRIDIPFSKFKLIVVIQLLIISSL